MATNLIITLETGDIVDMGPMSQPYDGIGVSRDMLAAMSNVAAVEWRDHITGHVAFAATRVSVARPADGKPATFGWRTAMMSTYAYGEL